MSDFPRDSVTGVRYNESMNTKRVPTTDLSPGDVIVKGDSVCTIVTLDPRGTFTGVCLRKNSGSIFYTTLNPFGSHNVVVDSTRN